MADIHQAIDLIRQGRKKEAQPILTELIRSNPHDVKSWFWYVETLDTNESRLQLLEACLKQNPGDQKVLQAVDMLRNKKTLNPPSQPIRPPSQVINPPSKPIQSRTQPPAQSPSPTSPRGDYYSPFPIKYEDREPEPAQSAPELTNTGGLLWDEPRRGQIPGLPRIHVLENNNVLDHLKKTVSFLTEIQPYLPENVHHERVHPDFEDIFIRNASDLPQDSKYIIYGFPALVHPKTGIIFGFVMGMVNCYRLPDMIAREYEQYLEAKDPNYRKNKRGKQTDEAQYGSPHLEKNWVESTDFTSSLVRKCFDYYGTYPHTNAVIHFNEEDDLRKVAAPPKPKRSVFGYFMIFLIVALMCLVIGTLVFVLAVNFQFDLSSIFASLLSGS